MKTTVMIMKKVDEEDGTVSTWKDYRFDDETVKKLRSLGFRQGCDESQYWHRDTNVYVYADKDDAYTVTYNIQLTVKQEVSMKAQQKELKERLKKVQEVLHKVAEIMSNDA